MKKVLVFGVFDGIHDGHKEFFKQVKKHGDHIIVAVTQDKVVQELKNKKPKNNLKFRKEQLIKLKLADEVTEGDKQTNSWKIIGKYNPDVIALGYDQKELKILEK